MLTQSKDLGINFTNDLHWSEHYETIIAKVYQTLGLVHHILPNKYLEMLGSSCTLLLFSTLEISTIERYFTLERVQQRTTKSLLNDCVAISSYKTYKKQLHILLLMYIFELNDLMFFV